MAELVDALASGASTLTGVEVRVLFWAPDHSGSRSADRLFVFSSPPPRSGPGCAKCKKHFSGGGFLTIMRVLAQMAELVDALASGASTRKGVEVRVLFWAPVLSKGRSKDRPFCFSTPILPMQPTRGPKWQDRGQDRAGAPAPARSSTTDPDNAGGAKAWLRRRTDDA